MKKKTNILINSLIVTLVVIIFGTSYAYFSAIITGDESESSIVLIGGDLKIHYDNLSGVLKLDHIHPRDEAWITKEFTVTGNNNTDQKMGYILGINVESSTFTDGALSFSLTGVNTSNAGEVAANVTNKAISSGDYIYLGMGHFYKGEDMVHTYTLNIYFKDTGIKQNENQKASFVGHVDIGNDAKTPFELTSANLSLLGQGYADNVVPNELVIPELIINDGMLYEVSSIGERAFYYATNLTGTLTIPSTVKSIGLGAFYKTGITGLTLNEGLVSIGDLAFKNASNLTGTLTIPSTVKTIGQSAFNQTGITGLVLNEGLEIIGYGAFGDTYYLSGTITIPSTVKEIGTYAFTSSSKITEVNYNGSEEEWNQINIGTNAFPSGVTINYSE